MECKTIREKLSAFCEGTVSPEEKGLIGEHLSGCPSCSMVLRDLEKTEVLVKGLEQVEPPPWLKQKVMTRIRTEEEAKKNILQKLFYPLHVKIPIEALATVLIAVVAIYMFRAIEPEMKHIQSPSSGPAAVAPGEKVVSGEDLSPDEKGGLALSKEKTDKRVSEEKRSFAAQVREGQSKAEASKPLSKLPAQSVPAKKEDEALKQPSAVAPALMEKAIPKKDLSLGDTGDLARSVDEREKGLTEKKKSVVSAAKERESKAETSKPVPGAPPSAAMLVKKEKTVEGKPEEVAKAAESRKPRLSAKQLPAREGPVKQEDGMVSRSAGIEMRQESRGRGFVEGAAGTAAGEKAGLIGIRIHVMDVQLASEKIENLLGQLGARKIKRESLQNTEVISAELQAEKIKDLFDKLASIGEVKEKGVPSDIPDRDTGIRIEIVHSH